MNPRRLLLPILIAASLGVGTAEAGWREAGLRNSHRIVIVDRKDVKKVKVYWEALRKVCPTQHCIVAFFDERTPLPAQDQRFTEEHLKQANLIYTTNKGFEWNCTLRPEADNCFRWEAPAAAK